MKSFKNGIYFALGVLFIGGLAFAIEKLNTNPFNVDSIKDKTKNSVVSFTEFNSIIKTIKGLYNDERDDLTNSMDNYIGVGVINPKAKLDIAGGIKLDWVEDCNIETEGTTRYNNNESVKSLELCDGIKWKAISGNGTCENGVTVITNKCRIEEQDSGRETEIVTCNDDEVAVGGGSWRNSIGTFIGSVPIGSSKCNAANKNGWCGRIEGGGNRIVTSVKCCKVATIGCGGIVNKGWIHSGEKVFNKNAPSTWTDLDLSSIIGKNRALVKLKIKNNHVSSPNSYYFKEGNELDIVHGGITTVSVYNGKIAYTMVETNNKGVIKWHGGGFLTDIVVVGYIGAVN